MGSKQLDELAPRYMRAARIGVTPDAAQGRVAALESVLVAFDYSKALPEGVCCPLVLEVQGPSPESYQKRVYLTRPPKAAVFTPREGGPHLVVLRELAHNLWHGELHLDVVGSDLQDRKAF